MFLFLGMSVPVNHYETRNVLVHRTADCGGIASTTNCAKKPSSLKYVYMLSKLDFHSLVLLEIEHCSWDL